LSPALHFGSIFHPWTLFISKHGRRKVILNLTIGSSRALEWESFYTYSLTLTVKYGAEWSHLLPGTPTYTISGQKLTPVCYRDTFLVLSCSSDVPSVSQTYLVKKLSLKMEKNLPTPQVLLSAHNTMKSPVLF
jgi:hypothetical protein